MTSNAEITYIRVELISTLILNVIIFAMDKTSVCLIAESVTESVHTLFLLH